MLENGEMFKKILKFFEVISEKVNYEVIEFSWMTFCRLKDKCVLITNRI